MFHHGATRMDHGFALVAIMKVSTATMEIAYVRQRAAVREYLLTA